MTTERFDTAMIYVNALRELVKKTDFSTPICDSLTAMMVRAMAKYPTLELDQELVEYAMEDIQENENALYELHRQLDTAISELGN